MLNAKFSKITNHQPLRAGVSYLTFASESMAKKDMSQPNLSVLLSEAPQIGTNYSCTMARSRSSPGMCTQSCRRNAFSPDCRANQICPERPSSCGTAALGCAIRCTKGLVMLSGAPRNGPTSDESSLRRRRRESSPGAEALGNAWSSDVERRRVRHKAFRYMYMKGRGGMPSIFRAMSTSPTASANLSVIGFPSPYRQVL